MKDTRDGLDMNVPGDRAKSNVALVAYFHELVQQSGVTCSFEIGAFSANFSRQLRKQLPDARIFAFEANPHNYAHFLAKEDFTGVEYINKGVADVTGQKQFCIQDVVFGSKVNPIRGNNSFLEKNNKNILYAKIDVPCVRLSEFVAEQGLIGQPTVLWIDVEGANQQVLMGCVDIFPQVKLIFIEVEQLMFWKDQWLEPDVHQFLTAHGFTLVARDGEYANQYNQIYVKNPA